MVAYTLANIALAAPLLALYLLAGAEVDVGALANATSQSEIIEAYTSDIGFLERIQRRIYDIKISIVYRSYRSINNWKSPQI